MTGNEDGKAARETNRFRDLADAYGADLARWPAADRSWAQAHLDTNAEAAALLRDTARLDDLLGRAAVPGLDAALVGRVLAAAPGAQGSAAGPLRLPGWLFPVWRPAGALAVALLLGLAVGAMAPPALTGADTVAEEVDLLGADLPAVAGLDLGGQGGGQGGSQGSSQGDRR